MLVSSRASTPVCIGEQIVRGRKPMPTHMKELLGNPGKRAINSNEPKPVGELCAAPEWMSDSQREGWAYAVTNAPKGLLKLLDRSILAVWVVAEDIHRQAAEKIVQFGLLTKSPNAGLPLQSPYLAILNKQAQIMPKAAAELGFSPSSRSRVQLDAGLYSPFSWLNSEDHELLGPAKPWEFEARQPDEFFGD